MAPRRTGRIHAGVVGRLLVLVPVLLVTVLVSRGETTEEFGEDELRRGGQLYARYCVACHGPAGEGGPGPDLLAGPPIDDILLADLVIRTGRMPLVTSEAGIIRAPDIDADDRDRMVAWMADAFGLAGEVPDVPEGDTARGRLLFNEHCAACHSTTGWGGVAGGGVIALPVRDLDRVAIFSAARGGPLQMPSIPESVLSDQDLADIATAVERMDDERPSPYAITDLTHVSAAVVSVVAVAVLVGLVAWLARLPDITVAREDEADLDDLEDST